MRVSPTLWKERAFPSHTGRLESEEGRTYEAKRAITRVSRCMEIPCGTQPFYLLAREYVVVSSPLCGENTAFFSGFPLGGSYGQGILSVIPLELQGKKHQPFSITQPNFTIVTC